MNQQERKAYIKRSWNVSSGKRITQMLKRYWGNQEIKSDKNVVELTEGIFKEKSE